jgi:hypothetical protein
VYRQSLVWNRSPFRAFELREHSAAHVSLSSIFNCQRSDTANAVSWALLLLASGPVECRSRGSLDLVQQGRTLLPPASCRPRCVAYIGGAPFCCQQRFRTFLNFLRRFRRRRHYRYFPAERRPVAVPQRQPNRVRFNRRSPSYGCCLAILQRLGRRPIPLNGRCAAFGCPRAPFCMGRAKASSLMACSAASGIACPFRKPRPETSSQYMMATPLPGRHAPVLQKRLGREAASPCQSHSGRIYAIAEEADIGDPGTLGRLR